MDIKKVANSLPSDTPMIDNSVEIFREDVSLLITKNPAAVVLIMQRMVDAIHECLMGIPVDRRRSATPDFSSRMNGLLGRGKAYAIFSELQGRLCLHWHGLYWCGVPSWLVQRSAGSVVGDCLAQFTQIIHSASADCRLHGVKLFNRLAKERLRSGYYCPPPVTASAGELNKLGEICMVCTNGHSHCATCRKSTRGERECRLQYPRPTASSTDTFYELHPIVTDNGVTAEVNIIVIIVIYFLITLFLLIIILIIFIYF